MAKRLGIGLVLVAVAVLPATLAWSYSTRDVARTASELHDVDQAVAASGFVRTASAQAMVFATNHSGGTASDEALATAIGELAAAVATYEEVSSVLRTGAVTEITALTTAGRELVAALEQSALIRASSVYDTDLAASYATASSVLTAQRNILVDEMSAATSGASGLARAAEVIVFFAMPALLALVLWLMARSRVAAGRRAIAAEFAEVTDRVDQMEELLGRVSHRYRTPLTSIFGLSDVLAGSPGVRGNDKELAALINSEAAAMYRVADDVLVASDVERGRLHVSHEIVSLTGLIDEVVKPLQGSKVRINVDMPEIWAVTDASKVRQILRNLLANAVEHGSTPISLEASETEGTVIFTVVDHGRGIPDEVLQASTDITLDRIGSPSLGLPVAVALADAIGATIEYTRDDNQTRFELTLAADEDYEPDAASSDAAASADDDSGDESRLDPMAADTAI